jgi:hypothetical protein
MRLSVEPSIRDSVWYQSYEIDTQVDKALKKEANERNLSKSITLRQIVREQLEIDKICPPATSTSHIKHLAISYLKYNVEIPVDKELSNKFEKFQDNRSRAQTMREILCTALGIQLSKIDLSWGHAQKVDARIEKELQKEVVKRNASKNETVRQLVREQLDIL